MKAATTHDLQMESYTEPYRAPEPQKPETTDTSKTEDTKTAIARLRAEIFVLTAELELNEATLETAKAVLSGTTN
jgi:hypothetical protein